MMDFPDEFALTDGRQVDRTRRYKLATLTGRAVPSEFVRYLLPQLREHLDSAA